MNIYLKKKKERKKSFITLNKICIFPFQLRITWKIRKKIFFSQQRIQNAENVGCMHV